MTIPASIVKDYKSLPATVPKIWRKLGTLGLSVSTQHNFSRGKLTLVGISFVNGHLKDVSIIWVTQSCLRSMNFKCFPPLLHFLGNNVAWWKQDGNMNWILLPLVSK